MNVREALGNIRGTSRSYTFRAGLLQAAVMLHYQVRGATVFNSEWDLCIILDACRPDLLEECTDEYEWLPPNIPVRWSVANYSADWMRRTFADIPTNERVLYISGNPFTATVFETESFDMDEVWRYAWDDALGTVPPRPITDQSITHSRSPGDYDRIITHYMQPHFPTLDGETGNIIDLDNFVSGDISPFEDLRSGVDDRPYWEAYRRNLKRVLDDVTLLLQNVQAERVLLTADHGNAWGEDGLWGHPPQPAHPAIRRVPWVVTTADDIGGYEPPTSADTSAVNATVQERLTALGYDE